ncbi:PASTA domain-containing protein [Blattabacterium cuenoti]|uniref:PASTA domain-containing protein n=1 Tax=Blattabacterium cuenoti TaxID=1653831 RepID=UPI00163BC6C0|nr:PASTA domain-containing protein [Blattabacterium cuenoti]
MNYSKYFIIFIINFLISIFILYKIAHFALKWTDIYTKHGSYVIVPNLRYMTLSQATSILKKLGLKYDIDTSYYDPNLEKNRIISFSPESGDHVKEGRHVYLKVNFKSKLKNRTVLPNIINKNKSFAIKLLNSNHILIKEIKYINDISKNIVLKVFYKNKLIQSGFIFPSNEEGITLIIGKGYEKNNLVVPNVMGMSLHDANFTLKTNFFHVINYYYDHPIIDPEKNAKVYRQNPSPGEIREKNKPVELWLTSKKVLDNLMDEEKGFNKKTEEKNTIISNE